MSSITPKNIHKIVFFFRISLLDYHRKLLLLFFRFPTGSAIDQKEAK